MYIDQNPVSVQCRKCEECRAHRRRHLLGKVIAEQQTSVETWFTTYTYGGGYENDAAYVLDYTDIQKTFKLMRKKGYRFRYLVAGEYGAEKGRAHWHVLYLWQNTPPEMTMNELMEGGDGYWEHGNVLHEYPRSKTATAAYCMKYLTKAEDHKGGIKKSIALGDTYLENYAREHARNGISLFAKGNVYTVKEQKEKTRDGRQYYYPVERDTGAYLKMLNAWLDEWIKTSPDTRLALSEDTSDYLEEIVQNTNELPKDWQEYIQKHYGYAPTNPGPRVLKTYFRHPTEVNVVIRVDWTGTYIVALNEQGEEAWQYPVDVAGNAGATDLTPETIQAVNKAIARTHVREKLDRLNQSVTISTSLRGNNRYRK